MKIVTRALGGIALCLSAAMLPAHGQANNPQSSDDISARYQAAKDRCDAMSGNQRDVCMKQAEADRTSAKATAKADKKSAEANQKAQKDKRDADYDVARQKCKSLSGDAQDTCEANAKAQFGK